MITTAGPLTCGFCRGGLRPSTRSRGRFSLLECEECGHVVSMEAIAPDREGEALQHRHFGDAFAGADDWWTSVIDRANGRRVRRALMSHIPPPARVLEIGPGRGAVLSALARAGYRVEGLDLSPAAARVAAARSGAPVRVGTLDDRGRDAGGGYGAVVARHVVEHMKDPAAALQVIRGLLRADGIAYLAVPNLGAPEALLPGWTGYQAYHLHYFRPATLGALLRRHGFAIVACRTREPFSGWTNAIVNSLRRPQNRQAPPPRRSLVLAHHTARAVIGAGSWPMRLVQQWSGYGEEIEVVARRAAS